MTTIFALASGAGRAGIAVIRISGPDAGAALAALTRAPLPPPREARRVRLYDADDRGKNDLIDDGLIDDGLALWFPAPASYTGEDIAELHIHGGRSVIDAVSAALVRRPGVRLAEAGEFTRRAFDNGKLDLTAAEGLADLINAETAAQRRQAQRQLQGELGILYDGWRQKLLAALAQLEAEIDFSDEDLPAGLAAAVAAEIVALRAEIAAHLDDGRRGQRLRDGVYIAVVGPPNAGKSSLVNWLARRDAAIVSTEAGTTRDVIEVHLDVGGYPVIVADTAGLREVTGEVESEGVRRARDRAAAADLTLGVFDGEKWPDLDPATLDLMGENAVAIVNKADLLTIPATVMIGGQTARAVSVKTGAGLVGLLDDLEQEVAARCMLAAAPSLTRARHRAALEECLACFDRFAEAPEVALAGEDLRLAARALGRVTGRVDVEDILDQIFAEFCIGK